MTNKWYNLGGQPGLKEDDLKVIVNGMRWELDLLLTIPKPIMYRNEDNTTNLFGIVHLHFFKFTSISVS